MLEQMSLISFIKTTIWHNVQVGTNLLGEPIMEKQIVSNAFTLIQEFCKDNNISNKIMIEIICKQGDKELLKQALEATKDVQSYGEAWLATDNRNNFVNYAYLRNLGASQSEISVIKPQATEINKTQQDMRVSLFDTEEDFVKFYLLGDKKRLWRFIKSKNVVKEYKQSLIAEAFKKDGIKLQDYINIFKDIENPKVLADVMWCALGEHESYYDEKRKIRTIDYKLNEQQTVAGFDMLTTYFSKFEDSSNVEDFLDVVFEGLDRFKFSKRKLKYLNNLSVNDLLDESLNNFYDAIVKSKLSVKKKISIVINNNLKGKPTKIDINTKKIAYITRKFRNIC